MAMASSNRKPSRRTYFNIARRPEFSGGGSIDEDADPLSSDGTINSSSASLRSEAECENGLHEENNGAGGSAVTVEISVDDAIDRLGMGLFQYRLLVAAGLCFASDAMEVLLLSFLTIILQDEWKLTDDETAFITSILFLGALVGTSILGPLADKWGRRPIFTLTASIIAIFGVTTSLARNYEMMLVIMFLVGFGVGGLTVPFDTLAEFLPSKGRGTNLLLIEYFWTLGCLLVTVFAELTLAHGKANWRLFVSLCSIPCFISIIMGYLYVPESVRWLVSKGRNDEAVEILREAARINGVIVTTPLTQQHDDHHGDYDENSHEDALDAICPLNAQLVSDEDHSAENAASCFDLFKPQWRGTMLRLWGAWGGFAFGYYGAILVVTRVFDTEKSRPSNDEIMLNTTTDWANISFDFSNITMEGLASTKLYEAADATIVREAPDFDYSAIFISSSAELVGTTLVILVVDRFGRISSQLVCYIAAGICILLLCALASSSPSESSSRWELIALGFLLRAFEMGGTCVSWVSTAEILSTEIRSTGHASANAMARLGAFFSPFLVDGHSMSLQTMGIIMLVVHWFTAACICQLPETKGLHMGGGGAAVGGREVVAASHEDAIISTSVHDEEVDGIFLIGNQDETKEDSAAILTNGGLT